MLIAVVPLTLCVSSCQLGATLGQNPFECSNVNTAPTPLISSLSCFCVLIGQLSSLFCFFLFCVCRKCKPDSLSVHHNPYRFFPGSHSCVCIVRCVICFVLLCKDSERVCPACRWIEIILWALYSLHTHTHTHSKYQGINLSGHCFFAKSRLEVDKSQLSSHKAIWNMCVGGGGKLVCICVFLRSRKHLFALKVAHVMYFSINLFYPQATFTKNNR